MRLRLAVAALLVAAALPVSVRAATEHAAHGALPRPAAAGPATQPTPSVALRLVADPTSPVVDAPVTIRLEGAPSAQVITTSFHTPGVHVVTTTVGSGPTTRTLSLALSVRPRKLQAVTPAVPRRSPPIASHQPRARAASDPGVTIVDFQFNPSSITINTGDTITWTNNGSQPHTATANDHSFDTGTLSKGQSASHTFNQPGTFSYICTIHPFMHGTVTVVSSGGGGGGSGSGGGSSSGGGGGSSGSSTGSGATSGSGGSSSSSSSQLPFTGFNVVAAVLSGLLLMASGVALRWWVRRSGRAAHPET